MASVNNIYRHEVSVSRRSRDAVLERRLSVSSRSRENLVRSRSRSRFRLNPNTEGISLGSQCLVLQVHFQRQKFTKLSTSTANRLSVGLYNTACRSRSLCFYASNSLNSCIIIYQAFVLFSTYLSIRGRRSSRYNVTVTESETSYSLVQVIATKRVDTTLNIVSTCNEDRQQQQLYRPCPCHSQLTQDRKGLRYCTLLTSYLTMRLQYSAENVA